MRKTRTLLSLVLIVGPVVASMTACGGDDSAGSSSGAVDAAPNDGKSENGDTGAPSDAATPPKASAASVTVYLGQAASLDGSHSTGPAGFTYGWTVTLAPQGSAVTTASVMGSDTAKPAFMPDRPGTYELTLTISAGSAKATANVTVTVVDPPVFYFRTENDASAGYQASVNVIGAGAGSDGTAVGCFNRDAGSYDSLSADTARAGSDWWEAPPGQPSRLVFVFETREDGGAATVLAATTSSATCATSPTKLDAFPGDPRGTRAFEQPRLSPSGNRVAYVRKDADGARVATVGFDGSAPRLLGALNAFPDGGPNPGAGVPMNDASVRPVWMNETTVAWLQVLDDKHWQIVSATDAPTAPASLVMSCTGAAPAQFDFLANGEVIVSQNLPAGPMQLCQVDGPCGPRVTDIVAYPIDAAKKSCGTGRNISKLSAGDGGSYARDFALSPDKGQVAYQANVDPTNKRELIVAAVDGVTPPKAIVAPLGGTNRGPRWVGGGAFLTWGVEGAQFDAGLVGNVVAVAAPNGSNVRAAVTAPAGGNVQAVGNGFWSCSFAPPVGSGIGLFGAAAALSLRLVRRRRR